MGILDGYRDSGGLLARNDFRQRISMDNAQRNAQVWPRVLAQPPQQNFPSTIQIPGQEPVDIPPFPPSQFGEPGGAGPGGQRSAPGVPGVPGFGLNNALGNMLGFLGPQAIASVAMAIADPKNSNINPVSRAVEALGEMGRDPGVPGGDVEAGPGAQVGVAEAQADAQAAENAAQGTPGVTVGPGRGPDRRGNVGENGAESGGADK